MLIQSVQSAKQKQIKVNHNSAGIQNDTESEIQQHKYNDTNLHIRNREYITRLALMHLYVLVPLPLHYVKRRSNSKEKHAKPEHIRHKANSSTRHDIAISGYDG